MLWCPAFPSVLNRCIGVAFLLVHGFHATPQAAWKREVERARERFKEGEREGEKARGAKRPRDWGVG